MPKRTFEDVVKIKKIEKSKPSFESVFYAEKNKKIVKNVLDTREKKKISDKMLWVIAFISVIALFFAVSFLFSNATVNVVPKVKDFNVNKALVASKNGSDNANLNYDLIVLSGEEKKEVTGGEEKDYKEYATGKILIYNAFSSSKETIPINTKLEGTNGKIYKTKNKVVIPGMKNKTPGKIGVDIYSEKEGGEYNSDPIDFKILPFKGTSKYTKIYARSVGDISGGLLGKSSQVSEEDKTKLFEELKDTLSKKLLEKAKNQIPKNFVLLNGATSISFDEGNIVPGDKNNTFILSTNGTFTGILFDKNKLEKEIINEFLDSSMNNSTESSSVVKIDDIHNSNIENLTISSFDQSLLNINDMKDLNFNLSGVAKIVLTVDKDKLASDLLGKNKNDFNKILADYDNIDSANMTIKPIWVNSFPNKLKDINIIVNYPN